MNATKIEWVKNPDGSQGYTFNPITGCLNGCPYCYANKLASGRLSKTYIRNLNIALPHENPRTAFNDPFYPRFWEEKLWEMDNIANSFRHRHTKGKGIFVCDMSDLFGIGIPEEWTRRVMQTIRAFNDEFRFYLLTKQPQNLAKWSPFPENCYVGVTITNTLQAIDAVTPMAQIEAKVKFVSYEPLLEKVPCRHIMGIVNWAIIGQQTPIRPETMPKIEWIKNIVEAADEVKVPVFLKNNLRHIFVRTSEQASQETFQETFSWALDNSGMKLRQEMPE